MKASVKLKGLRAALKALEQLGSKSEVGLSAVKATAKAGVFLRDKAKSRAYVAQAPYKVYYQGRLVTLTPGSLGDQLIVKRMTKSESKGYGATAMHVVTVRQKNDAAANIGKISNIYEARHPFIRPTAQADGPKAQKIAIKSLIEDVRRKGRVF
ncbi:hypothetical protein ADP71_31760 [Vitreoscilla sp. C1]|uniref:hypothetical protein n=1 Tax=Vitreoscilla sp. (strain C1) TaxID=96942 RepID=UPI000CDC1D7F|nr:hypothetical protein [Vitreoscilla sp. C1]AUZ06354.1 hypothetical protein ADP71_31760 [Vitreoscilla sp. C1]